MFTKTEFHVLILGIDKAGKTTLLEKLKSQYSNIEGLPPDRIVPTVGLNIGRIEASNTKLVFWDLGGQIKIKCSCGEDKCPEWAIVELQGVVEVQAAFQHSFRNLPMGTLCRPSSQENYTFTVGYHELIGSKVTLKKPFLVLKKVKLSDESGDVNSGKVEMEVIGIIRHRILFKTRPKALISSSQPLAKTKLSGPGSTVSSN